MLMCVSFYGGKEPGDDQKGTLPQIFFMMCDPIADRMKTSIVGICRGYKNCWLAEPTNVTQVGMKLRKYDHRVRKWLFC